MSRTDIEIRRFETRELPALAALLAEGFADDVYFREVIGLTRKQMPAYWRMVVRLFSSAEEAIALGAFIDNRPVGAAIIFDHLFNPGLTLDLLYNARFLLRFGPRAFALLRRFNRVYIETAHPRTECLRLLNITVAESMRGRGIGLALLEAYEDIAYDKGLPALQLECDDPNPARRLYERFGFATERTFVTAGVVWHVMVKKLEGNEQ